MATIFEPSLLPEIEKYTRIAAILNNKKAASKLLKDKGIDLDKGYSQDQYLSEILNKQILTSELPPNYLTPSEELYIKQAAKRSLDQISTESPIFKQNKLMENMNMSKNMSEGATVLNFSDPFGGINWGKTMAFVGKHTLGVGLATMAAGGGIGLVASVAATYAVSVATRKVVFAVLEQIGVMGAIRSGLSSLLKKLSNVIKFDKIRERAPMLATVSLGVVAGAALIAAATSGVAVAADDLSGLFDQIAEGNTPSGNLPLAAIEVANEAIDTSATALEGVPPNDLVGHQKALIEGVLNANGAFPSEVCDLTDQLTKHNGFEGMMAEIGKENFRNYENLATVFGEAEPSSEFSLLRSDLDAPTEVPTEAPTEAPKSDMVDDLIHDTFKDFSNISDIMGVDQAEPATSQPVGTDSVLKTVDHQANPEPTLEQVPEQAPAPEQELSAEMIDALINDAFKGINDSSSILDANQAEPNGFHVTVEKGDTVWGLYDDYLKNQGIEFESDAERKAGLVDFMQEVARLNPDLESIHKIKPGDVIEMPEIANITEARDLMEKIEVTAENNVLSSHTYTEGMIEAEKTRLATEQAVNSIEPNVKPDTINLSDSEIAPFTQKMSFTEMDTKLYENTIGNGGFIFEDNVNDKAKALADHYISGVDQSNYSQIEKDYAKSILEDSIVKNTTVSMANEGKISVPSSFSDLDMVRLASSVDNEYVGKWVLEHGSTYNESGFYMDSTGIIRNADSIEQVAASIAQEMSDRGGVPLSNAEVGSLYNNVLETIKQENNITGVERELDKIKIPEDMRTDLRDQKIVQVREQFQSRFDVRPKP